MVESMVMSHFRAIQVLPLYCIQSMYSKVCHNLLTVKTFSFLFAKMCMSITCLYMNSKIYLNLVLHLHDTKQL